MKTVVITGVPGSGTTTVLKNALKNLNYVNVNYGDVMLEIAKEKKLVEDRDQIRKLPSDIQREIQKEAARKIRKIAEKENVIVDTHCTIKTPTGFLPGLPKWVLDELNPQLFILVEADPEEILVRRINDKSRSRDMEKINEIKLHQEMNRAAAMAYAVLTGASVKIIENHDEKLDEAVNELVNILEGVKQ
ncbi:Adenylate kinase [Methanothermus fervidus DSM 2088]|uniref:Adenylate kinase n=1 Tax=Methanothermus fervidus (strain ATCC 43054 / DSM 2088 / JCM 10308 / V24 S) TaxID=523846 RepID=E3GZE3_METFV|nr:adenylate kinase [Methanothermus fervidus]ADP77675.1 Adenylate kinase [Methanothermus fervidus DSM 2088]